MNLAGISAPGEERAETPAQEEEPLPAWMRPALAILAATALLLLWSGYVYTSITDQPRSLESLASLGFDPYWFGLAAQEVAVPLVLLFLFSRTALFHRAVTGGMRRRDRLLLPLVLLAITLLYFLSQYGLISVSREQATLGFFTVFVAALLGGWPTGLTVGILSAVALGLVDYLSWAPDEPLDLTTFLDWQVMKNMPAMGLVWLGFSVGAATRLIPRWRFHPWTAVGLGVLAQLVVALGVFLGWEDSSSYFNLLPTNLAVSVLAILAFVLMVRNVQDEAARRQVEATQLELARTSLALTQTQLALTQAELRALHAQINPHFLFNTLNTIRYFVRTDPGTARELLTRLSEIFQRTLSAGEFVPLQEEILHVEAYLALEKARLDDRLQVIWTNLAKDLLEHPVPTLILQPLVENAVIHGISPKPEGGTVHIVINRVGEELLLQVDDDGVGFDPQALGEGEAAGATDEGRPSIGLSNVDERLRMIYGDAYRLTIESAPGQGARVVLRIPLQPQPRE